MKRLQGFLWAALAVVLCFSGTASGQALSGGMGGALSSLPLPAAVQGSLESIKLNPYAQVGYTHVGCNMTIPIAGELIDPGGGFGLEIGGLDLFFEDFNVWTATVGLNAVLTPKISAFCMAVGAAPRLLPASGTVPISTTLGGTEAEITFTASDLEIWAFQAGMGYGLMPGYSVIAGYYWDHTSVALSDPRQGSIPLANQTLKADLIAKSRIPFIGLQIQDPSYVGIFTYSPLAWVDVTFALRNSQTRLQELSYSWNKPGQSLTAYLQYNATPPPTIISLWCTGSWLHVRGPGQLEFESIPPNIAREKDSTATMGKYSYGGGISVGMMF